jgi:hypothetical protein
MAQFGVIQQYIKSSLYSIQYFLAYEEFIKIIIMMNCDQWCQDIILVQNKTTEGPSFPCWFLIQFKMYQCYISFSSVIEVLGLWCLMPLSTIFL